MKRILGVLVLMGLSWGCGKAPSTLRYRENQAPAPKIALNTCQGNELAVRVMAVPEIDFMQAVKGLVSATMDPQSLGSVSGTANGTTGVDLYMVLAMSESKQILGEASQFRLEIRDSMVGQKGVDGLPIDPIRIVHNSQSDLSGSWDAEKGLLTVIFKDAFGEIQFSGTLQNSTLSGKVTYKNLTSWSGGVPSQGTLGQFQSQAGNCGF